MKRLFVASLVLCASAVFAQEIGKEIPADQQQQQQQQNTGTPNYDNPYATQPAPTPTPVKKEEAPAETTGVPGPRKMAFGIRAGFGGGGIPDLTGAGGGAAPTIGLKLLATDSVGINFDLGLGLGITSGSTNFGFGLGLGVDAYLGHKDLPIRPFVTGGAAFGKAVSSRGDDFLLSFNVGGGGEYWFNDHFSVNGRALVGVPINLDPRTNTAVSIATFTPGIGGTFYF